MGAIDFLKSDLFVCGNDYEGVGIAAKALQNDIKLVSGNLPAIKNKAAQTDAAIIIGTIGKSSLLDGISVDVSEIAGKRECFTIQAIDNALVVAGSDKRGTIYGIYKISEMLGVSPWVWWADCVPQKKTSFTIEAGYKFTSREPSVKYRGFFCNDEAPSLTGWVGKHFGKLQNPQASQGYDSEFYAKVFELILRLKGNYFWPVMWNNSFHTDDPKNSELAHKMGIVMGTSHHEHMTCADKEWTWSGLGDWNYHTNKDKIYKFWNDGVEKRKEYESIITLGMRGQADTSILGENATLQDNMRLLQSVIDDQRTIIGDVYGNPDTAPQMIALYKEVEDFYYGDGTDTGKLQIPDDVTLMLCDDNFGNLRTLPTDEMLKRKGGFGMYYHFDYRGGPISYEWINQTPLPKIWDNMTTAYDAGVRDIWIVNVGDLKPMELPLSYFMELAYDMDKWHAPNQTEKFTHEWAAQQFGVEFATAAAKVLNGYTKILGARKAEVVLAEPSTFSLTAFNEAGHVMENFEKIVALAEKTYNALPQEKQAAFYQLALYPTRAAYNTYKTHIFAAWSLYYEKQGSPQADEAAKTARQAFEADAADTEYFNTELSGGKWDGIMRQNHMGYTTWDGPKIIVVPNEMPKTGSAPPTSVGGSPTPAQADKSEGFTMPNNLPPNTFIEKTAKNYISINPAKFIKNTAADNAQFTVIKGYGREADSLKVLPNGKFFPPNAPSPTLEYSFYVREQNDYMINVFIAPANPPRNTKFVPQSEQLRFAVQIDDNDKIIASGLPKEDFTPGHGVWNFGVLDNIRIIQIPCGKLAEGVHALRVFAVDAGVIIQKIVIADSSQTPDAITYAPATTHFMGAYFGPPESFCS